MARLHDIVFDSAHPASLARFWAAALDDYDVAPYDDEEIAKLQSMGFSGPEDDPSVMLIAPGTHQRVCFQLIADPKAVKNRVHLDLRADDVEAEAARLVALGATILWRVDDFITLADPEGNELCLFPT
jgi:hypothetical protein